MDEIKEFLEKLKEMKEDIEQSIKKPLEDITEQDVEKWNKFIKVYREAINLFEKLEKRVEEIKKELKEADDTAEKYYLVPREEIISPEKEENLNKEQEKINKEIAFRDNLDNFTNLAKEASDKINEYKQKKRQEKEEKESALRKEKYTKLILEPSEPEFVWEIRNDEINEVYSQKPVSAKVMRLIEAGAIELAEEHLSTR